MPTGATWAYRDSPIPTAVFGMRREPPDADPHVRWCGRSGGHSPRSYPIHPQGPHHRDRRGILALSPRAGETRRREGRLRRGNRRRHRCASPSGSAPR
jgi:hypothetical protein